MMKIKDLSKCKNLSIYYEDFKYPTLYGIISEAPLILLNEDGDMCYYPDSIDEMVQFDRDFQEDNEFVRFEITGGV